MNQVIIKPGGVIVIAAITGIMGFTAYKAMPMSRAPVVNVGNSEGSSLHSATTSGGREASSPVALTNPSFEGIYSPLPKHNPKDKGFMSGEIAAGWVDNSEWGDISVAYSKETMKPHSGKLCQKIMLGKCNTAQVQLVQQVNMALGKTYQATVWVRAATEGTIVGISLRPLVAPYLSSYESKSETIGKDWKQITVTAPITKNVTTQVMVACSQPNRTFWVDDAAVEEVKK